MLFITRQETALLFLSLPGYAVATLKWDSEKSRSWSDPVEGSPSKPQVTEPIWRHLPWGPFLDVSRELQWSPARNTSSSFRPGYPLGT